MTKNNFSIPISAEQQYVAILGKIAHHIEMIIKSNIDNPRACAQALTDYAALLEPWAPIAATEMLANVRRDRDRVWNNITEKRPSGNRYLQAKAKKNGNPPLGTKRLPRS
jgi:hypothetical protein